MRAPSVLSLPEVQQSFRDVHTLISPLAATTPYDWKRRRLMNLLNGQDGQDAATVSQLTAMIAALKKELSTPETGIEGALTVGPIRVGVFAARGAPKPHRGELFIASDRSYTTWVSDGASWWYLAGQMVGTLSPDTKPTDLVAADVGFNFYATDYRRSYAWTGSAWTDGFRYGVDVRGLIAYFLDSQLPSTGWALCDGSGATISTSVGGTTAFTTPNLTGSNRFVRSVSGATGGTGGSATTHTHGVTIASATTGTNNTTQEVQNGTGRNVAADGHAHNNNAGQTVTSAAPSGSGGSDALPPYLDARPYIRL